MLPAIAAEPCGRGPEAQISPGRATHLLYQHNWLWELVTPSRQPAMFRGIEAAKWAPGGGHAAPGPVGKARRRGTRAEERTARRGGRARGADKGAAGRPVTCSARQRRGSSVVSKGHTGRAGPGRRGAADARAEAVPGGADEQPVPRSSPGNAAVRLTGRRGRIGVTAERGAPRLPHPRGRGAGWAPTAADAAPALREAPARRPDPPLGPPAARPPGPRPARRRVCARPDRGPPAFSSPGPPRFVKAAGWTRQPAKENPLTPTFRLSDPRPPTPLCSPATPPVFASTSDRPTAGGRPQAAVSTTGQDVAALVSLPSPAHGRQGSPGRPSPVGKLTHPRVRVAAARLRQADSGCAQPPASVRSGLGAATRRNHRRRWQGPRGRTCRVPRRTRDPDAARAPGPGIDHKEAAAGELGLLRPDRFASPSTPHAGSAPLSPPLPGGCTPLRLHPPRGPPPFTSPHPARVRTPFASPRGVRPAPPSRPQGSGPHPPPPPPRERARPADATKPRAPPSGLRGLPGRWALCPAPGRAACAPSGEYRPLDGRRSGSGRDPAHPGPCRRRVPALKM
ncbi:hypothetical protein HPG69_008135 [Diceros bicornis minor]|uniref:Uncharacterized protein n=1 Tax=Diceros bicornis minor TaxID=77932 RepID=A0A7J7F6U4_DICBM|nr:hypothetical protein HPG69_008135 [Diceros bicornis minor]